MARHSVGYTPSGSRVFRNVRQEDGYPLMLMEEGETRKIALNFAAFLESGETISSATVSTSGVTASIATSSPTVTLTLSSPTGWGTATVTVTTSNAEVIVETIRARQNARAYDPAEVAYAL